MEDMFGRSPSRSPRPYPSAQQYAGSQSRSHTRGFDTYSSMNRDESHTRRQSYNSGYGSTANSAFSTRYNSPEPRAPFAPSAPLAIDNPAHFTKYPPYSILFGEFMRLSGAHEGLKSELAAAKVNLNMLQQLLQRQPPSPSAVPLSSPLVPSNSAGQRGVNSALPAASISISLEDRKEYGSPLKKAEYPNAKFWVKKEWKTYFDSYGDRGEKGPYYLGHLTDENGDFVGKEIVKAVRNLAFRIWNQWFVCWVEPTTWSKKRDDAWLFFKIRMYEGFFFLRLCEGDWKVNDVGIQVFSDWSSKGLIRGPNPFMPQVEAIEISDDDCEANKPPQKKQRLDKPKNQLKPKSKSSSAHPGPHSGSSRSRNSARNSNGRRSRSPGSRNSNGRRSRSPSSRKTDSRRSRSPSSRNSDGRRSRSPRSRISDSRRSRSPHSRNSNDRSGPPSRGPSPVRSGPPSRGPSPVRSGPPSRGPSPARSGPPSRGPSPVRSGPPSRGPSPVRSGPPSRGPSPVRSGPPSHAPSRAPSHAPSRAASRAASRAPSPVRSCSQAPPPQSIFAPNPLANIQVNLENEFVPPPESTTILNNHVPAPKQPRKSSETALEKPSSAFSARNLFLLDHIKSNDNQLPKRIEFKALWDGQTDEIKKEYTRLAKARKKENHLIGKLDAVSPASTSAPATTSAGT